MQADLLTKIILPLALFLIMFGLGLSLTIAHFKAVMQTPKAVLIGLIGQLLLLPLLAFTLAWSLSLSAELAVGLMIIALAPGGATSNMFTYLFKGDVSLSISLTAVVSIVTSFSLPIGLLLSMQFFMGSEAAVELPLLKTLIQLFAITLLPVGLGMWVLSRWSSLANKLESFIKGFSIFFLFLIIVLIVLKNAANMPSFFAQIGLATLLLNLLAIAMGYGLAKISQLNQAQSICIGFEVGIQNGTLALVVAGTLIGNTTMMMPAVTYSLLMFITGAAFGAWVKR